MDWSIHEPMYHCSAMIFTIDLLYSLLNIDTLFDSSMGHKSLTQRHYYT